MSVNKLFLPRYITITSLRNHRLEIQCPLFSDDTAPSEIETTPSISALNPFTFIEHFDWSPAITTSNQTDGYKSNWHVTGIASSFV